MFWSLVSGCTVWSLFEALTMWAYANEVIPRVEWSESPVYLAVMVVVSFFWGTFHFYVVHRWLHWRPLYRPAHELHHRNVDVGQWSGLAIRRKALRHMGGHRRRGTSSITEPPLVYRLASPAAVCQTV